MKTSTHWHVIIEDALHATQAGAYGVKLHTAINDKALRGQPLKLALICVSCSRSILIALEKIHYNHFQKNAGPPSITCSVCGSTGGHHYHNIQY